VRIGEVPEAPIAMPALTACPEWRAPAEVVERFVMPSTDAHVRPIASGRRSTTSVATEP
jgi:hypothetical protein